MHNHNIPTMLLRFPKYVFIQLCHDWIGLSDLCNLDSACCSKYSREILLNYFCIVPNVRMNPQFIPSSKQYSWIKFKKLNTIDVLNFENDEIVPNSNFVPKTQNCLHLINAGVHRHCDILLSQMNKLTELHIWRSTIVPLHDWLSNLQHLKILSFSNCIFDQAFVKLTVCSLWTKIMCKPDITECSELYARWKESNSFENERYFTITSITIIFTFRTGTNCLLRVVLGSVKLHRT